MVSALTASPLLLVQERAPGAADARFRNARELFNQRKWLAAAAEARIARQLDPGNAAAWKLSGLALQLAKKIAEAEQEFAAAIRVFPGDPDLWFYLGRVRYLNHTLRQAEEAIRRALRLNVDHSDAHTQLGLILDERHQYDAALEHYRKAAELNARHSRPETMPLASSSRLLLKLGRLEASLRDANAAVAIAPRNGGLLLLRGRIFERLGNREAALRDYLESVRLSGDTTAHAHAARLEAGVSVSDPGGTAAPRDTGGTFRFENEATQARLTFELRNCATENKYQVETMIAGVAAFDYDGDGWQDVYFVNGAELPALKKTSSRYWNRLFRNNGDGTFADTTARAGVAGEGYSMGVAAADYDNDGDPDLFVAGVDRNILFRNNGDGTFTDATAGARVGGSIRSEQDVVRCGRLA